MKKIFLVIFILLFFPKIVYADKNVDIDVKSTYTVSEDGSTKVLQNIKIKNKTETLFAPTYSTDLAGIKDITNIKIYNKNTSIPYNIKQEKDSIKIEITFQGRVAGLGKINEFNISYDTNSVAKKRGNVWEINIPGLANPEMFHSFNIDVKVPKQFKNPSIIKPLKKINNTNIYSFTKDEIKHAGIFMIFGNSQVYNFNLNYHISNPNLFPIKTEIALPPSTNYQEVFIKEISIKPNDVREDEDGNWLAIYSLESQEKKDIKVIGTVLVNSEPKQEILSNEKKNNYLKSTKYWEANSLEIVEQAAKLQTPKDIYYFVVNKLKYSYDKSADQKERLGAEANLKNPNLSVCIDFTDLFIALSRANGIPSRSVEGFAYTENNRLKPLSLENDVLHAWPEYYDDQKKTWVMVDPTWGNTTGGIEYYKNIDLEHIAFVIKGINSSYPIPAGGYKDDTHNKDINIEFGSLNDINRSESFSIEDISPEVYLSGFPVELSLLVRNNSFSQIKNKDIELESNLLPYKQYLIIDSVPPYGSKIFKASFDRTSILTNGEYNIKIQVGEKTINKKIKVRAFPVKYLILIGGGICVTIIFIFIIAGKLRSLFVQRQK